MGGVRRHFVDQQRSGDLYCSLLCKLLNDVKLEKVIELFVETVGHLIKDSMGGTKNSVCKRSRS